MICLPAILIFKLLKRFPILVLFIYSTEAFSASTVETEREERTERMEFAETIFSADVRFLNSDAVVAKSVKKDIIFSEKTPSVLEGFVPSASHKLYVLFSQWITDRCFA